ncbi:uncharacterized protein O3C94_011535 isoform 1-T3 [Discoglossus pictus]
MFCGPVSSFVLLILPAVLSKDIYMTTNDGVCTTSCDKHDETSYYWCEQKGYSGSSWDYCSPSEGYDYTNEFCTSTCSTRGSSYRWCYKQSGGWNYCGHITEEVEQQYTRYNIQCINNCDIPDKSSSYFLCYDLNGNQEYCSPSNDVTIKGEPCRTNHQCGTYGETYHWCYIDDNDNWDYCGQINSECVTPIYQSHRRKRQTEEELCRIFDTGNRRVTILRAETETRLRRPSRSQFTDASHVINMITADSSFSSNAGTMFTYNTVRLDVQGSFMRNNEMYINVQVQINGPRDGQSSVAQVLFPADFEISRYFRYIRRALQTSMRGVYHGDPVKVFIIIERT